MMWTIDAIVEKKEDRLVNDEEYKEGDEGKEGEEQDVRENEANSGVNKDKRLMKH